MVSKRSLQTTINLKDSVALFTLKIRFERLPIHRLPTFKFIVENYAASLSEHEDLATAAREEVCRVTMPSTCESSCDTDVSNVHA
jgi:hypothetical protein